MEKIFIIILLSIKYTFSQQYSCNDETYCLNGGVCTLTSSLPATKRCNDNEVFNNDACFSSIDKLLNWKEAAQLCYDQDSVLPVPETSEEQIFLQDYIQGSLTIFQNSDARVSRGVWTGVRSVSNGSNPAWVYYPGSYLAKNQNWKIGEPNLYPDWNDVCVSINEETFYKDWQTQTCEKQNHVVCERKLNTEEKNLVRQCSCLPGYEGSRCEDKINDSTNEQNHTCASESFFFSCPSGTIIVDYALYGSAGTTCSNRVSSSLNLTCSNPHSLQTINNKCQGLNYCNIDDLKNTFAETSCYVKEELRLQYRFRCSTEVQAVCPTGSIYNSGRCFTIIFNKNSRITKQKAQDLCREMGGQLPTDLTSASHEELVRQIEKITKTGEFWLALGTSQNGAIWDQGSEVTFAPPKSDLSEALGCAVLAVDKDDSYWKSTSCTSQANYICETAPTSGNKRSTEPFANVVPSTSSTESQEYFKGDQDNLPNIGILMTVFLSVILRLFKY